MDRASINRKDREMGELKMLREYIISAFYLL